MGVKAIHQLPVLATPAATDYVLVEHDPGGPGQIHVAVTLSNLRGGVTVHAEDETLDYTTTSIVAYQLLATLIAHPTFTTRPQKCEVKIPTAIMFGNGVMHIAVFEGGVGGTKYGDTYVGANAAGASSYMPSPHIIIPELYLSAGQHTLQVGIKTETSFGAVLGAALSPAFITFTEVV